MFWGDHPALRDYADFDVPDHARSTGWVEPAPAHSGRSPPILGRPLARARAKTPQRLWMGQKVATPRRRYHGEVDFGRRTRRALLGEVVEASSASSTSTSGATGARTPTCAVDTFMMGGQRKTVASGNAWPPAGGESSTSTPRFAGSGDPASAATGAALRRQRQDAGEPSDPPSMQPRRGPYRREAGYPLPVGQPGGPGADQRESSARRDAVLKGRPSRSRWTPRPGRTSSCGRSFPTAGHGLDCEASRCCAYGRGRPWPLRRHPPRPADRESLSTLAGHNRASRCACTRSSCRASSPTASRRSNRLAAGGIYSRTFPRFE